MIDRWNILHLKKRHDRAPTAYSNAERLGVPREKVRFWYGKDADDFTSTDAMLDAIVADGFPFSGSLESIINKPGKVCQLWNVWRFLRDLADRNSIEMLIHDGILIRHVYNHAFGFYPDFQWFCDVVERCVKRRDPFKLLTIGDIVSDFEINPIEPGSLILEGIGCIFNSVRIYSSQGAQVMLERIKKRMQEAAVYSVDMLHNESNGEIWDEPGMYTLLMQSIVIDMPSDYFGSDSQGWGKGYKGEFKRIFRTHI